MIFSVIIRKVIIFYLTFQKSNNKLDSYEMIFSMSNVCHLSQYFQSHKVFRRFWLWP
jgi:hypothetical protein